MSHSTSPTLLRTVGLWSLVIYGVGDMIGSGIYGTVGKAAGQLGNAVWLAFVVSMIAAMLTAFSYASLSSRYPRAGGAAYITHRAFRLPWLSYLVGLTIAASGLTSMATQVHVFSNNLQQLMGGPWLVSALLLLVVMTGVNLWGIRHSMWANVVCTLIEVGGLIFIIAVGIPYWGSIDYLQTPQATFNTDGSLLTTGLSTSVLLTGAVLTFFSFIGFEDMLNVAEEVKDPRRTMPWGIVLALGITTVLYLAVAITAVSVVDYRDLAAAPSPLAAIANRAAPWLHGQTFVVITMFAAANTMLINYIMGSRLLYGMARQGLLPQPLARLHPRRRTPYVAIYVLVLLVLLLAALGGSEGVRTLASATGLLLLGSFIAVNASLLLLKRRTDEPKGGFEIPSIIPVCGILVNATLIVARVIAEDAAVEAPLIAGGVVAAICLLYLLVPPREVSEETLAEGASAGA